MAFVEYFCSSKKSTAYKNVIKHSLGLINTVESFVRSISPSVCCWQLLPLGPFWWPRVMKWKLFSKRISIIWKSSKKGPGDLWLTIISCFIRIMESVSVPLSFLRIFGLETCLLGHRWIMKFMIIYRMERQKTMGSWNVKMELIFSFNRLSRCRICLNRKSCARIFCYKHITIRNQDTLLLSWLETSLISI